MALVFLQSEELKTLMPGLTLFKTTCGQLTCADTHRHPSDDPPAPGGALLHRGPGAKELIK